MENKLGRMHKFKVLRETQIGYMLTMNGEDEYFLHKNESNFHKLRPGDEIVGFLYSDKKARIAVTLITPNVTCDKCGFAEVMEVNYSLGVFVDIGISKDILVSKDDLPIDYKEWPAKGDVLLVILKAKSERLVAKMLNKHEILKQNLHLNLPINERVTGYVYRITEDGINVVTKNFDVIFVHKSQMKKRKYRLGEKVEVKIIKKNIDDYVGTLIEEIDKQELIALDSEKILKYLEEHAGVMSITDKSDPIVIYKVFKMSKNKFKDAIGYLYKQKLIEIFEDKIILL